MATATKLLGCLDGLAGCEEVIIFDPNWILEFGEGDFVLHHMDQVVWVRVLQHEPGIEILARVANGCGHLIRCRPRPTVLRRWPT